MSEHSDILEKAAGIIREKGKLLGNLWNMEGPSTSYQEGPVCAIGALSIASGTDQTDLRGINSYEEIVEVSLLSAVADECPVIGVSVSNSIYSYSDQRSTTAEDIAQMFERAAKNV